MSKKLPSTKNQPHFIEILFFKKYVASQLYSTVLNFRTNVGARKRVGLGLSGYVVWWAGTTTRFLAPIACCKIPAQHCTAGVFRRSVPVLKPSLVKAPK